MPLSFAIDDLITKELKHVDIKIAQRRDLLAGLDSETRGAIHRQTRISTIGATTRIENAILTDAQIEWIDTTLSEDDRPTAFIAKRELIQNKLSKDRERSLEEVAGCREMLALIFFQGSELFPLTQATIRGLHQELLKYYAPAAFHLGRYKVVFNSVVERNAKSGTERMVLQTCPPGPITEAAMSDLIEWYNNTLPENPWPLAVASEFVFRFLACHPFQDGNGRIGRALFLLTLLQGPDRHLNQVAPFLAIDRYIEQHRPAYYAILAKASGGKFEPDPHKYDIGLFLRFMLKAMDAALDFITFYKERIDLIRGLSPSATLILKCFKELPEQRLTPKLIREETNLAERTISRSLRSLCDAGLIQRYGHGAGTRYQLVF